MTRSDATLVATEPGTSSLLLRRVQYDADDGDATGTDDRTVRTSRRELALRDAERHGAESSRRIAAPLVPRRCGGHTGEIAVAMRSFASGCSSWLATPGDELISISHTCTHAHMRACG
jgi:hypothetical protein